MTVIVYYISVTALCGLFLLGCTGYDYRLTDGFRYHSVEYFLSYFQDIKDLPKEELYQEFKNAEQNYLKRNDKTNSLKLLLVLIASDFEFQNSHQPAFILDDVINHTKDDSVKNLSLLLQHVLVENQKKDSLYQITQQKLNNAIAEKREQEAIHKKVITKLNAVTRAKAKQDAQHKKIYEKLLEKEQTIEKLQKKIEELKAIERSINERKNTRVPST